MGKNVNSLTVGAYMTIEKVRSIVVRISTGEKFGVGRMGKRNYWEIPTHKRIVLQKKELELGLFE